MLVAIRLFFAIFGAFGLFLTTFSASQAAYMVGARQSFEVGVFLVLAVVIVCAAKIFGVVCAAFSNQRWCREFGLAIAVACAGVMGFGTYWGAVNTLKMPPLEVFPGLSPVLYLQILAVVMALASETFAVGLTLTALKIAGGRWGPQS